MAREKDGGRKLNYYFSAFSSAARSVTFVLQYVAKDIPEFDAWYSQVRNEQAKDPISKFLLEARNEALKTGVHPIAQGKMHQAPDGSTRLAHFFLYIGHNPPAEVPTKDVISICTHQMTKLVAIVNDFFCRFESQLWNPVREREEMLELISEAHKNPMLKNLPDSLWPIAKDYIHGDQYQETSPMMAIKDMVAKYLST